MTDPTDSTAASRYPQACEALRLLGCPDPAGFAHEYDRVREPVTARIDELGHTISYSARQDNEMAYLLYALTRFSKPALVIETGVASGFSSAVILSAMQANGAGRLISLDYPAYSETARQIAFDVSHFSWGLNMRSLKRIARWAYGRRRFIPPGMEPGWAVPDALRERWTLLKGESRRTLQSAARESPDIFIHDSDHSYANMDFELQWGWARLRPGGVIMADDIKLNAAWDEFVQRQSPATHTVIAARLGIARK